MQIVDTTQEKKDYILSIVSECYGVDLFKDTHQRAIAFPRMVAMYLLWKFTKIKITSIGEMFGRNHSVVSHSVKKVNDLCWGDQKIRKQVIELESKLE